jgi:SNF2 family DNA or RNA helicase
MNAHAPPTVAYTFPPTSFHVQRITATLFMENKRAYCLSELGTGKTRSILFAFDALKQAGLAQRMLVVCPLSAMVRTWRREIMRELPWLKATVLHGTRVHRTHRLLRDYDVYIINHDGVNVVFDDLVERHDIDVVCADEVAVYRNGQSARTKTFRAFVKSKPYVWALTGSPMPRAVTDVWGPCSCLTPGTVPKFFTIFRDMLMVKKGLFTWIAKPDAEVRAVACMQPSVRFRLDEVSELPPRVIEYYEAALTPRQHIVYEGMRKQAVVLLGDRRIDALNAGAVLSKLLQISLGYVYARDGSVVTLDNTPRLQLILDLIDSASQKVLLFVPFKSALAALSTMLTNNNIDHAVVSGDTPLKQRNEIFSAFQDTSQYKVIAAHPACMAHSLTLTKANTTIWAGPVTSLEIFTQANGRTHRVGQEHKTLIAMVGGTPMERRIYKLLGQNEQLQNKFLEIVEAITEEDYSGE